MVNALKSLSTNFWNFIIPPSFRFSTRYRKLQNFLTYYEPEQMMQMAFDMVSRVFRLDGDYMEFGSYQGASLISAYHFARARGNRSMRFYAFDSFQGLPKNKGIDDKEDSPYKEGQYSCDIETFKRLITRKGVDLRKVALVPGWFDQTLNDKTGEKLGIKKASIVWIDCDLYESTVPVLKFITDYLQNGTIIVFDDWFSFKGDPDSGEQRAFREWLEKNPKIVATEFRRFSGGNSFIINFRNKTK